MAEVVSTILECPFRLDTSYSVALADQRGAASYSVNPTNLGTDGTFYVPLVARSGATGTTETQAKSFMGHIESVLGSSYWGLQPTSDGRITIRYKGTGNGSVTSWGAGNVVRSLLGFDTTVGPLATNGTQTGTYPAPFLLAAIGRRNSEDWQPLKPQAAYSMTDLGVGYGWDSGTARMSQRFDLVAHPRDWTQRTALGASGTPMYPPAARYLTPPTANVDTTTVPSLPWSVIDHVRVSKAKDQVFIPQWATLIGGTPVAVDIVQLELETYMADRPTKPMQANWTGRFNWDGFGLRLREKDVSL